MAKRPTTKPTRRAGWAIDMIDTIKHPVSGETYAVQVRLSDGLIVKAVGPMGRPYDDPSAWLFNTSTHDGLETAAWLQAELDAFDASLPPEIGTDAFGEPPAEVVS